MNTDMNDIFGNDNEGIFSDNMEIFDIYNLNEEKPSDVNIFPLSMTVGKESEGKKVEKKLESNSGVQNNYGKENNENIDSKEEPKKSKINVMSIEETKSYFSESVKNENIEAFIKEFKRNGYKKKQPDGTVWNEVTKKFEKSQDMLEIEKELQNLEKDKESEIKNFHAKSLNKEISDKIKRNPEKSKEILKEYGVKKLDPKEAFKDLNKDLYNEVLYQSTSTINKSNDRHEADKKFDRSKLNNKDSIQKNFYNKQHHYSNNKRKFFGNRRNRKERYDRDDKYFPNHKEKNRAIDDYNSNNKKNSNYQQYYDTNSQKFSNFKNSTNISKDNDGQNYYRKYSDDDYHSQTRSVDYRDKNRSKSINCVRDSSQPRFRDKDKTYYDWDRSPNIKENLMDKSLLSNISNIQRDKSPIKNKNGAPIKSINIVTPENYYQPAQIDLTDDDVICYMPFENENMKRKKLHEEMKDLVVNLKGKFIIHFTFIVDNINYILNNASTQSGSQVEFSLEEFSSKLIKDLKLISNESHYFQMLNCINYVDTQVNVNSMNVLPEYINFRDKSMINEKEVLVNAMFYYMYLCKSLVKSSIMRNVDLKIIQDNFSRNNKNVNINSNCSYYKSNKIGNNQNNKNDQGKHDYIYYSNKNTNYNNNNKYPNDNLRKTPSYIPSQLEYEKDKESIKNGEMLNSLNQKNINIATMLFGDLEQSKKSSPNKKINTDNNLNSKSQINNHKEDLRSRSKSPLPKDRMQVDYEEKNKRDKSVDRIKSRNDNEKDQVRQRQLKDPIINLDTESNQKSKTITNKPNFDDKINKSPLVDKAEKKNRERDRSKSPLRVDDARQLEIKKDFLNKKRSSGEKDDPVNYLEETVLKKRKKFGENTDLLLQLEKNESSPTKDDDVLSTISKSKVRKTPVEEKENKIRKNEEKEKSKSAIQSKLKDMLDRDEKYNLIMKYAHKITDADNLRNLKTLIPKENYVKIENALNGKSKEDISVELYENDLIKIMVRIFPTINKFDIVKKLKVEAE